MLNVMLFSEIVDIFRRYLSPRQICPEGSLKRWIKRASKIVRSKHRLATCTMTGSILSINSRALDVDVYFAAVRRTLFDLEKLIHDKVLQGFPVSDHYSFPNRTQEDFMQRKVGFGLFWQESPNKLSNTSSRAFTNYLGARKDAIVGTDRRGKLLWHPLRTMEWLSNVNKAWHLIWVSNHVLTLPARSTEIQYFQVLNSQDSIRHLLLYLETLATLSNYNKTTSTTDVYKQILRLMPKSLAKLLAIMLQVVRPVELLAVADQHSKLHPTQEPVRLDKVYKRHLFITDGKPWTAQKMGEILRRWFTSEFNLPWGINRHRHMAKLLKRRYLKREDDDQLDLAADGAMGHGPEGARNYAVMMDEPPLPGDLIALFRRTSEQWISMHGLKTFEVTDLKELVEKDEGVKRKHKDSAQTKAVGAKKGKVAVKKKAGKGKGKDKAKALDSEDEGTGGDDDDDYEEEDDDCKGSHVKDDQDYVPRRSSRRK